MMLSPHPLFNPRFYKNKYGHTFNNTDPLSHFIRYGSEKSYHPCSLFDTDFYRSTYQIKKEENALIHFIRTGAEMGYAPNNLFLEAQKTEPLISFSFFSNTQTGENYIILDSNKNVRAFKEILTKHIRFKPNYIYVVDSKNLQRFQEFLDTYESLFRENRNKVLVIVTDKVFMRQKPVSDAQITYIFLSELSVRLNKTRRNLLLIRLLIQLCPELIHFYDIHSFEAMMNTYQKQLSQISRISLSLPEHYHQVKSESDLYGCIDHIFSISDPFVSGKSGNEFNGNIYVYPAKENVQEMYKFRQQLINHYIIQ